MLLALKMEKGVVSQRMWAASRSWAGQGDGFSPGVSRKEHSPADRGVSPVRPVAAF